MTKSKEKVGWTQASIAGKPSNAPMPFEGTAGAGVEIIIDAKTGRVIGEIHFDRNNKETKRIIYQEKNK